MKKLALVLAVALCTVAVKAQNKSSVSSKIQKEIKTINIRIEESINELNEKEGDSILQVEKIHLKQLKEFEAKKFAALDKYERKSTEEFKKASEYEYKKISSLISIQQKEVRLINRYFSIKREALKNKRAIVIAKLNNK